MTFIDILAIIGGITALSTLFLIGYILLVVRRDRKVFTDHKQTEYDFYLTELPTWYRQ